MKIIRHTARDMRQAMRVVREQLGEDAVILSSKRTSEGVEVTAAVDFDASTLEAGGFANTTAPPASASPRAPAPVTATAVTAAPVAVASPVPVAARARSASRVPASPAAAHEDPESLDATELTVGARAAQSEDREWISAAAREAVVAHAQSLSQSRAAGPEAPAPSQEFAEAMAHAVAAAPTLSAAPDRSSGRSRASASAASHSPQPPAAHSRTDLPVYRTDEVVERVRASSLGPLGPRDTASDGPQGPQYQEPTTAVEPPGNGAGNAAAGAGSNDAMGNELKTLRRMLETQLAHLAWNDLTRRAPVRTEILRELTEIGITQDLAEHLVRQLPEDTDLTFGRRFTIAGLSQYLRVTGDRWLDEGGRVAFAGATGVGKTTTLAKVAVRWVLRHGPRDIALVAADPVRIGAQDQLRSLAQLLGVAVYSPDRFENLPSLLSTLTERLVLIDTPGSSARDAQLGSRLSVLANTASKLETALVLSASTQAGALEEAVRRFAPANPSCCVLTKLDEAASIGGVLSILIRARLAVSYVSEGQRVPEDLRPARALELVSEAVRLAKASGAAADEDLLRRRFGKIAHGIT
ncbi:MAG TPA: flagellar biosynthesis protein FlhF [Steroidobacteraceae bacterium]|jgi:flagellar biosynthesis protein FlhF